MMDKLRIIIFDVQHGDSILLHYFKDNSSYIGIIDSNFSYSNTPKFIPAQKYLKKHQIKQLEFACLTHPHSDHFLGLYEIVSEFKPKKFINFPASSTNLPDLYKKLIKSYSKSLKVSHDRLFQEKTESIFKLFKFLKDNYKPNENWLEYSGPENNIRGLFPDNDIEIKVLLPFPKFKGPFFQALNGETFEAEAEDPANSVSIALQIKYKGVIAVLGGDAPKENWYLHKKLMGNSLGVNIYKVSHHGSKNNTDVKVIDYLFLGDKRLNEKFALISANGKSHPHKETLEIIKNKDISPYCTNINKICGSNVIGLKEYNLFHKIPKHTRGLIRAYDSPSTGVTKCQGDIFIEIDQGGNIDVSTETNAACPYRFPDH